MKEYGSGSLDVHEQMTEKMGENFTSTLRYDDSIQVIPEKMVEKALEVAKKVRSMRGNFEDLNSLIRKTKEYWIGDAGEKHRRRYEELVPEIEQCLKRLEEHPKDLLEIAKRYINKELQIVTETQSLPSYVVT